MHLLSLRTKQWRDIHAALTWQCPEGDSTVQCLWLTVQAATAGPCVFWRGQTMTQTCCNTCCWRSLSWTDSANFLLPLISSSVLPSFSFSSAAATPRLNFHEVFLLKCAELRNITLLAELSGWPEGSSAYPPPLITFSQLFFYALLPLISPFPSPSFSYSLFTSSLLLPLLALCRLH